LNDPLRLAAERRLTLAWDGDVGLEAGDQRAMSGREHVHRFRVLAAPAGSPSSVVVKQPRLRDGETFDARADTPATTTFFNELACLQLLTELRPEPPSPRLYCADTREGLLVMEDFGSGDGLDDALLGSDRVRAAQTLVALFETVGQMHAATFGHRARFDAILAEHGQERPPRDDGAQQWRHAAVRDALDRLEVRPHGSFFDELAEIGRRTESDAFETLVHGDPCPDNCRWVGDRVRLLDFEHGRFGSAFSDACYPRIHFPTCWCTSRLPEDVARDAVDAYRRELSQGVPDAADEQQFERGMLDASIVWAWSTFAGWHMPDILTQDQEWGLVTVRQRILFRFRRLLDVLQRDGWYPAVTETTRETRAVLSARWPDVADMPLYPAFR
jgi:tRNA A-37 threonylcarbamoyl transferase component Bud32